MTLLNRLWVVQNSTHFSPSNQIEVNGLHFAFFCDWRQMSNVTISDLVQPSFWTNYFELTPYKWVDIISTGAFLFLNIQKENLVSSNLPQKTNKYFLRISDLASKMGQIKKKIKALYYIKYSPISIHNNMCYFFYLTHL